MGCQSDGKYIATISTKSFDGLCCPPPILNKTLLDTNLTFEYKFSLIINHGQGHALEKQKNFNNSKKSDLQAHCSDWLMCSELFILRA